MTTRYQISTTVAIETEECCVCGVTFAMPASLREKLLRDGGIFYCPAGHGQSYCEPEVPKLKRELRKAERRNYELEQQLNGALGELNQAIRENRKLKKRAHSGVCQYCKRHFANLQRHMETKHQDKLTEQ